MTARTFQQQRRMAMAVMGVVVAALAAGACRRAEPPAPPPPPAVPASSVTPPGEPAPSYPPCGETGQPDCPLAAWMDAGPNNLVHLETLAPLAATLRRLATIEPAGYPEWDRWALQGAASADHDEREAVKAACKGCHDQYRARYRLEMRGRPISIPTGAPDAGAATDPGDDSLLPSTPKSRRQKT
jgi:hypothetical protein